MNKLLLTDDIGSFFDKNAHSYSYVSPNRGDYYFLDFIKAKPNQGLTLLDIGGGAGRFAKLVANNCSGIAVTVLDPSENLLSQIDDVRIRKVNGWLPNGISVDSHFDYIHITHVLHHITGSSIRTSKELVRLSLAVVREYLKDNGFLLIHETFYESYLIPSLSRTLLFYLLALQQKLGIRIPASEFLADLRVCFYTRPEFKLLLGNCGFEVADYQEEHWVYTHKKRAMKKWAMCVKDWGEMMLVLRKAE